MQQIHLQTQGKVVRNRETVVSLVVNVFSRKIVNTKLVRSSLEAETVEIEENEDLMLSPSESQPHGSK